MEQPGIKTYIINLPKDTDRRICITKELSKITCLDPEFVDAVDGRALGTEKLGKLFDFKKNKSYQSNGLALGEVGCTLSHYECYKRLLASDQKYALIVEDDIGFKGNEPFDDLLGRVVQYVNCKEPVVIQLFSFFDYMGKGFPVNNKYKVYKTYKSASTTIYLINKPAARIIVSAGLPYWIADDWSLFRRLGVRTYALYPSFAYHKDETFCSSIGWNERKKRVIRIPRSRMELCVLADECIRFLLKKLGIMKHKEYIRYRE
ncbi:glycosyltransferase family 25 protein [Parabacteroides sp.]